MHYFQAFWGVLNFLTGGGSNFFGTQNDCYFRVPEVKRHEKIAGHINFSKKAEM